jgi:SSS family solute:Na+ symporter
LNSSATLVALDIVKRFRPGTTDAIQIATGRISAVIVMLLAMGWSTFGNRYSSIFEAINVIAADLAPPITTVFLWGVFWRRGTHQAAVTTLAVGFLLGVAAFVADLPLIGTEKVISHRWGISFLMQAWWVFCFCSILFVLVSFATDPPKKDQIEGLTWERPFAVLRRSEPDGGIDPKWIAGTLLLFLLCLYYVFA